MAPLCQHLARALSASLFPTSRCMPLAFCTCTLGPTAGQAHPQHGPKAGSPHTADLSLPHDGRDCSAHGRAQTCPNVLLRVLKPVCVRACACLCSCAVRPRARVCIFVCMCARAVCLPAPMSLVFARRAVCAHARWLFAARRLAQGSGSPASPPTHASHSSRRFGAQSDTALSGSLYKPAALPFALAHASKAAGPFLALHPFLAHSFSQRHA